ncbi:MAG: uracil-DNA glycosylase family protein [Syntrophobacteraceae bacterium]
MWQCSPEVPWPRAGYAVVGSIVKMDRLAKILESARSGHNQACKSCARNPKKNTTSFARNCDEHFGVKQNGLIIIARDPGASDGGSSQTGKICPIHNHDASAKRVLSKVALLIIPNQSVYFLNAILHGYFDLNSHKSNNAERNYCKVILTEILGILNPTAILALGIEALSSSIEILQNSNIKKPTMKDMISQSFSFGRIAGVSIFAMPHPAYAAVNLGKYGLNENEVWERIAIKINDLF